MWIKKTVKLHADPSTVWAALTNPELTKRYLYECEAISDWKVGSPLVFRHQSEDGETIPVKGIVKAFEPNETLEHTCFETAFEHEPSKHTTIVYQLTPANDMTELSVTQGEFPEEEDFQQHDASWDYVLNGLKLLLEGTDLS